MSIIAKNKANIMPIPTAGYKITSSDVVSYLESQVLGFKFACDFTRWTGIGPEYSYVRMRCVFNPKDLLAQTEPNNYADKVLFENAAGLKFKDTVISALKPFMYPNNMANIVNEPESLVHLRKHGVFDERLRELIHYSKFTYDEPTKTFLVYLRPERIIAEMLSDPDTNKVPGTLRITAVDGTTSDTIRWMVVVSEENFFGNDIPIDAIYGNVK